MRKHIETLVITVVLAVAAIGAFSNVHTVRADRTRPLQWSGVSTTDGIDAASETLGKSSPLEESCLSDEPIEDESPEVETIPLCLKLPFEGDIAETCCCTVTGDTTFVAEMVLRVIDCIVLII